MQLGDAIKIVRQKAFLSQEAFSNEINVSVSSIKRWETGKVKPSLTAMKKIQAFCEKYNLSYNDIENEWFNEPSKEN